MRFRLTLPLLLGVLAAFPGAARSDLLLNEVLYDPDGLDEALEFVELWNPDPAPRTLEGVRLEAGDGARPGEWAAIFSGSAGDTVPAGAAFLIGGAALLGPIQNGPDALRLTRSGATIDLVGWGDLESASLYEGAPAPDVPSGSSLARKVDGVDSGVNGLDWEPAPPTPGRPNRPEVWIAFEPGSHALEPPVPWPREAVALRATVRNRGRLAVSGAAWSVEIDVLPSGGAEDSALGDARPPAARLPGRALAPGESLVVAPVVSAPVRGAFVARARLIGSRGDATADTAIAIGRSGPGPAVVNEIAFRGAEAGEWIEIAVLEPIADLGLLGLADASGRSHPIDTGGAPRPAAAGELLVLAEEPDRVVARFGLARERVLGLVGGWSTLNDADGAGGTADVARLFGPGGSPWDAVPYRAAFAVRGSSLERLAIDLPSASAGSWGESVDPRGGTPAGANSLRAPTGSAAPRGALLLAAAAVLAREGGVAVEPAVFRITAEARGRTLRVRVEDLLGRSRRTLVDGQRFAGEGAFAWNGRDEAGEAVPPGLYVVRAEALGESGAVVETSTVTLAVVDRRPR